VHACVSACPLGIAVLRGVCVARCWACACTHACTPPMPSLALASPVVMQVHQLGEVVCHDLRQEHCGRGGARGMARERRDGSVAGGRRGLQPAGVRYIGVALPAAPARVRAARPARWTSRAGQLTDWAPTSIAEVPRNVALGARQRNFIDPCGVASGRGGLPWGAGQLQACKQACKQRMHASTHRHTLAAAHRANDRVCAWACKRQPRAACAHARLSARTRTLLALAHTRTHTHRCTGTEARPP